MLSINPRYCLTWQYNEYHEVCNIMQRCSCAILLEHVRERSIKIGVMHNTC